RFLSSGHCSVPPGSGGGMNMPPSSAQYLGGGSWMKNASRSRARSSTGTPPPSPTGLAERSWPRPSSLPDPLSELLQEEQPESHDTASTRIRMRTGRAYHKEPPEEPRPGAPPGHGR